MNRKVTKDEELAYRLCHHEFGGHSVPVTAAIMGIKPSKVYRLLASLKKKAPQLFPIMTRKQYVIYKHYISGMTQNEIATVLGRSTSNIQAILKCIERKGFPMLGINGKTVRYNSSMDKHIKEKF